MLLTSDYASYFIIMRLHVLHGPYCYNVLDFLIIIQSLIIESTLLSSFTNLHTFKCNHCHHCTYDIFAVVRWCFLYPYGWVFHYFVMFHSFLCNLCLSLVPNSPQKKIIPKTMPDECPFLSFDLFFLPCWMVVKKGWECCK